MPIAFDSYYIYSLSTFKTFTKEENELYNNARAGYENAKHDLATSLANTTFRRNVNPSALYYSEDDISALVGIFENELIRYIKASHPDHLITIAGNMQLIKGLVFMEVGKKHSGILKSIIDNGLTIDGAEYRLFTSGSGQMRKNEISLVEASILERFSRLYDCGLTVDEINAQGGINTGKYLAYSALPLSSSKPIEIDINKVIVVPDLEMSINKEVERIDTVTFKSEFTTLAATGKKLNQTDGAGLMLPSTMHEIERQLNINYPISGLQIRAPWIKGALFPFDFQAFALLKGRHIVKDIFDVEHDIFKEGIEVILTASQFKAKSYYKKWEDYKSHFIANGLRFSVTAVSNLPKDESRVNYQFLQTLDKEKANTETIAALCKKSTDQIKALRRDISEVLKAFGATEENPSPKPLQQAIMLYPNLLHDKGVKYQINKMRQSQKKECKEGKLLVSGFYGYAMPDMYGFCEYLFEGKDNPQGLIEPNEVYCHYYRDSNFNKADCLRAPHLGNEHSIRKLNKGAACAEWFKDCGTNVIYSLHDYLMLACMGDVDGDSLFITPERALIDLVKPHSVLSYEMPTAPKQKVNKANIFETLKKSFECNDHSGGNTIGCISNTITKI